MSDSPSPRIFGLADGVAGYDNVVVLEVRELPRPRQTESLERQIGYGVGVTGEGGSHWHFVAERPVACALGLALRQAALMRTLGIFEAVHEVSYSARLGRDERSLFLGGDVTASVLAESQALLEDFAAGQNPSSTRWAPSSVTSASTN